MINTGKNRVHEKVKDMRQNYSKVVVNKTGSGSGRIVYEHYDKLVTVQNGSANTERLAYGVQSDSFKDDNTSKKVYDNDNNYVLNVINVLNTNETTATGSANSINQNKSDGTEDENYENNVPLRKNCDKKTKVCCISTDR